MEEDITKHFTSDILCMYKKDSVTAILNIFKRADYLERQIIALLEQSHYIQDYIVWVNDTSDKAKYQKIIDKYIPKAIVLESSKNLGVWSRFFAAYNAKTEYIFVVDDDIIPGKQWIENCVHYSGEYGGIMGSWGSLFNSRTVRKDRIIFSESVNRLSTPKQIDISGHSWFFRKDMLPYMFDTLPEVDYPTAGEELWISYRAITYGIPTYILPMSDDKETWGNKEPKLGLDKVANYNTQKDKYQEFFEYAIQHGFTPLAFKPKYEESASSSQ